MFVSESDIEFNRALSAANPAGCAYGYESVDGHVIPSMSVLGTNADGFRAAFDVFKRWGCEVDGDVIEVTVVLKRSGGYYLIISPNMEHFFRRMSPDYELMAPLVVGLYWIKPIDSSNPILWKMRSYSKGGFAPVAFSASSVALVNGVPAGRPQDIQPIAGLPEILIYKMKFITEEEEPNHWVLSRGDKKNKFRKSMPPELQVRPRDIAKFRRRAIDQAFPVTRQRVIRAKLFESIAADSEFAQVTGDQVTQAVINLLLSHELAEGRPYYEGLTEPEKTIWDHIFERYERADGNNPVPQLLSEEVKRQIKLDVLALLRTEGIPTNGSFIKLQKEMLRLGYA